MIIDPSKNSIVCGDNLEWLKWLPDNSVDVCYIDPPFFSNRTYEVIWGNGYETRSFGDRFSGGIGHYIEWMRPRVELIYRKLKPVSAIFLHCDWHAVHRLRCMLEDIFGENSFVNEIYWKRQNSHNDAKHKFPDIVDTILFFKKGNFVFKPIYQSHDPEYVRSFYKYDDNDGLGPYALDNMASPNPRPNMMYDWEGYPFPPKGWRYEKKTMKKLHEEGRVFYPKKKDGSFDTTKRLRLKRYIREQKGNLLSNWWDDIQNLQNQSKEKLGYPTQKPVALIKRILECSSSEGDLILDCFGGGGSTAKACIEIGRRFVIGDVSPVAVKIMAQRLNIEAQGTSYEIRNLPKTIEEFQSIDGHEFAEKICDLMGWEANSKKSADGGIDGWDNKGNPVQVKNHSKSSVGRPNIQKFHSAIIKVKKKKGFFVAWDFSRTALEYIADIRREHNVEIVAVKCSEVFGDLVIQHDKAEVIKELYRERYPNKWKEMKIPNKNEKSIEAKIADIVDQETEIKKAIKKVENAKNKIAKKLKAKKEAG